MPPTDNKSIRPILPPKRWLLSEIEGNVPNWQKARILARFLHYDSYNHFAHDIRELLHDERVKVPEDVSDEELAQDFVLFLHEQMVKDFYFYLGKYAVQWKSSKKAPLSLRESYIRRSRVSNRQPPPDKPE